MKTQLINPVRHIEQVEPPRNRWRQPKMPWGDALSPSSYDAVSDKGGLMNWAQDGAAEEFAINTEAADRIRMIQDRSTPEARKQIRAIVRETLEGSQMTRGRDRGNMVHLGIEHINRGGSLDDLSTPFVRAAAEAYLRLIEKWHLEPLLAEVFIASQKLGVAGTADLIMGGAKTPSILVDTKSSKVGAEKWSAISWATQLSLYANCDGPYCHERGQMTWADAGVDTPNRDFGLVLHIPSDDPDKALIHKVDLAQGMDLIHLSASVRQARKNKTLLTTVGGL